MGETYHPRGELVDGYHPREHPSYTIWAGMKTRCTNESDKNFANYGARGITYCDRWKHFANFAADLGMPPFEGASIDRIDNDGNYEPGNVRWADNPTQMRNRRRFKNNRSGETGVVPVKGGRFNARYDDHGERFNLGRHATAEDAADYRKRFIDLLATNREAALAMCERRVRCDSATGVKGVTRHVKNENVYFIARRTDACGKRVYVGRFHSVEAATAALRRDL